ncbi:MAG: glycosyl hydrolase 53 family protein [Bacteroidales bacterium]|nr:glycosyl hydrolase 53 family protein [Bacteroidales bacterium]
MRILSSTLPLLATLTLSSCSGNNDFVKGADVGFLTAQEQHGVVFHDRNGNPRECLELLKNDYQMSAIRMRVWVDPRGGSCDKHELLAMARRAKALGMDLMVDFHYSDWWADPAKQPIPKAWLGHSFEQMKEDLRLHTVDVLSLLRDNDIHPRWVQVGNETANGMLWSVKTDERGWEIKDSLGHTTITHSMGHIKTEPEQYAGFIGAGYDAVKEVFPDAIVIVHLDRGHLQSLYDYNLDTVLKYGGKFDMVGMSLYPYWAMQEDSTLIPDNIISDCIANIRHVNEKYGCDVMIVETGFEVDEEHPEKMVEGRRLLTRVIKEARSRTDGHCRGVFYWEPQCLPGGYKLGAFDSNAAPTQIMEAFLE